MALFSDCVIGLEFAGRRADTGQRVMGMAESKCLATNIIANINLMTTIPEHWSMEDAVTILSTYSTLWYGLIQKARLVRGESVLIHSGTGGVGQSAINICKHYNCDIYVTVGNDEKKSYIVKEYGIPEQNIFSSRDLDFKYKIMKLTNGNGVDIVINSLTGEKLDASYSILAQSGRFVEIGKYDMVMNKQIGMFNFLKDISFISVGADIALMMKPQFIKEFYDWMHENSNNGCVKPYNKNVFGVNEADKAFRYMTSGKHIGKIVIKIRDEENDRGPITNINPSQEMVVTRTTYFNPNKVYIITGGLGGFGLELMHWMITRGARKFVITSRSGIKNDYQKFIVNRLRFVGEDMKFFKVSIEVSKNDCYTPESTQDVLDLASSMGQIGGIFHSGLILNDSFLEKMSYEQFCQVVDTKYKVLNNFDKLTRQLDYHLDYFVIYSSIAGGRGNFGQSNYAMGNSLCEHLCEQRRKDGLNGLAIQFGPIADSGAYEEITQFTGIATVSRQRVFACCESMEKLLATDKTIVTSYVRSERSVGTGSQKKRMIAELWKILGIDPENTPDELTLGEIGLESMFAVELQQELEREYNMTLTLNQIKTLTVGLLKDYEKGNTETIKASLDQLKRSRELFAQYDFTIASEPYTKLNKVTKGRPIYFMPPIETNFSAYLEFAERFDRPVIGLNWTRDVSKFETYKETERYFTGLLKKLEPNGDYDVVGSLDGAMIVVKQMTKDRLRKGVIIDVVFNETFLDVNVTEDVGIEMFMFFLCHGMPDTLRDKLERSINKEKDTEKKIKIMVHEFKEFLGRSMRGHDFEEIFRIAVKRSTLVWQYRAAKKEKLGNRLKESIGKKWAKKKGKLHVIKAFSFDRVEDIQQKINVPRHAYLLPESKV